LKIALFNLPNPALAEPWTNFPLGLGYVAAATEASGYTVQVHNWCEQAQDVPDADVYGMQITAPQVVAARALALRIKKKNPAAIVVAGGPQMLVEQDEFVASRNFDSVIIDEAEQSFPALLHELSTTNTVRPVYRFIPPQNIDRLPFPARHLFPDFKRNALRTHQLL
jgi:radical SAM superfamily enzyme YgiQ (UPF0313 family)